MARRPPNYNVLRGFRGATARQRFLDYLAGLQQSAVVGATGRNKPDRIELYIRSFNYDLPGTVSVRVGTSAPAWNALKGVGPIGARTKETLAGTATSIKPGGFKPARVSFTTGLAPQGTNTPSKRTGLIYKDYGGSTATAPFGKSTDTDTYADGVTAIRGALVALGGRTRITFSEEDS